MSAVRPVLHVCITCRAGELCADGDVTPGARLYGALEQLNDAAGAPVELRSVACLAACDRGCTAAISTPGQFGYLLGGLSAGIAGDVLDYAQRYPIAANGFVLRSKRAASLRDSILGRIPNLAPEPLCQPSPTPPLLLPCAAGEVAAQPTEGANAARAPSTTLRVVPLPRYAGEEIHGMNSLLHHAPAAE
jgi:predicted metal-binding protein